MDIAVRRWASIVIEMIVKLNGCFRYKLVIGNLSVIFRAELIEMLPITERIATQVSGKDCLKHT